MSKRHEMNKTEKIPVSMIRGTGRDRLGNEVVREK
jgi:hypothetical protein